MAEKRQGGAARGDMLQRTPAHSLTMADRRRLSSLKAGCDFHLGPLEGLLDGVRALRPRTVAGSVG
jgi:hypothetical protein